MSQQIPAVHLRVRGPRSLRKRKHLHLSPYIQVLHSHEGCYPFGRNGHLVPAMHTTLIEYSKNCLKASTENRPYSYCMILYSMALLHDRFVSELIL